MSMDFSSMGKIVADDKFSKKQNDSVDYFDKQIQPKKETKLKKSFTKSFSDAQQDQEYIKFNKII